jgi:hypothetical protein
VWADGGVQVVDVCLVVAGVVDLHCFGVEVRFESGVGVAEGWEGVGHVWRMMLMPLDVLVL